MSVENPVNRPQTKGFREFLSVLIRRIGGQESVDNEMPVC